MRDFVRRVCLFAALQLPLLLVVLWQGRLDRSDHFYRAMHDKLARLETSTERPRLIVLGGSSAAFGVHSQLLRDDLDMEPTNLGLEGALLRTPYLLRECETRLREGDVVVLVYEHLVFCMGAPPEDRIFEFVQQLPSTKPHFLPAYADMLEGIPGPESSAREFLDRDGLRLLANATRRARLRISHLGETPNLYKELGHELYSRSGFNRYGDFVLHYGEPTRMDLGGAMPSYPDSPIDEADVIAGLNWFADRCEERGVKLCFVWSPMATPYFEHNRAQLTQLSRRLSTTLRVPQLTQPEEALYPLDTFFDTGFHLNEAQGEHYTRFMIERLRSWLAESAESPR